MSREGWSRRHVLKAVSGLSTVGLAGCPDDTDADDFDPELAEIVVGNLDDEPHTVSIELHRGTEGKELVNRTREMGFLVTVGKGEAVEREEGGPVRWRISDFPGRGTDFTLTVHVDDGDQHTVQKSINDCTRFRVEIQDAETVTISEETKTVCYGQDG